MRVLRGTGSSRLGEEELCMKEEKVTALYYVCFSLQQKAAVFVVVAAVK